MLYWSYGSNLNPVQMRQRCPTASKVGPLVLDEGRLVFRGVADVLSDPDRSIAGGVWRVKRQDEDTLDRFEGVSYGVYKKKYLRLKVNGVTEDCLYYQMTEKRGIMPPSEAYLETITRGYEYFGLDLTMLSQSLEESWSDKKVTRYLRERHDRRGRPVLARKIA